MTVFCYKIYLTFIVFLYLNITGIGQAQVIPEGIPESIDLLPSSLVYEDQSASLKIADLIKKDELDEIEPYQKDKHLSYSFTSSTIWVKTVISNPTNKPQDRYLGSIRPELSRFNMYLVDGSKVTKTWLGGASTRADERAESTRLNVFRVSLAPNSQQTYYFEIRAILSLSLVLESLSPSEYVKKYQIADATHFFYAGTMFSLVIYSLFFYLSLKDIDFLFYSIFGILITASDLVYSGFLEYWGLNFSTIDSHDDAITIIGLTSVSVMVYVLSFFRVKLLSKYLYYGGLAFIPVLLFAVVYSFERSPESGKLIQDLQGVAILYCISVGSYAWYKGNGAAKYFVTGWGIFSVAVIIWMMGNEGVIDKNFVIASAPLFGNIVEMVLTAVALSYQFNRMKEDQFQKEIATAESDSMRTLVQVVCHDIANPLGIILGSHSIATRFKDADKQEKCWERVGRGGEAIEAIIDQVRRMAAIRSGKQKIKLVEINMAKAFEEVRFVLGDRAAKKGIHLVFNCADDVVVMAELTALVHDVLNNFVSNAIKFSDSGTSIILKAENKGKQVKVSVRDQGIGMPQSLIENLFSDSKETSRAGTQQEAGTGFGMPLAKFFIDTFDATLKVESKEKTETSTDHGTLFVISFKVPNPKHLSTKAVA